MKFAFISLLILLTAFIAADVLHVANLWNEYRTENVLIHFSFAFGAIVIVCCNAYFVKFLALASRFSQVKLLMSFFGQLTTLALFSKLTLLAWIGCKPCDIAEAQQQTFSTLGALLLLMALFAGLFFWSRTLCMPNPTFKRGAALTP